MFTYFELGMGIWKSFLLFFKYGAGERMLLASPETARFEFSKIYWVTDVLQVAALLLLSQQEERYILESNVNAALQNKTEELQRNLQQVILLKCLVHLL